MNTPTTNTSAAREAGQEQELLTRSISTTNRTGTFSARAEYTPTTTGQCVVRDWIWDDYGILPGGVESRVLPLAEAQAEYRDRKASGWKSA